MTGAAETPAFYVLATLSVLIAGISKGGFGGGVGMMAVPLMALVISPITAAAIMLPILCLMDLVGLWVYRGRWDIAILKLLVPAALCGIAIGALTFRFLDVRIVKLILAVIALAFSGEYWFKCFRGSSLLVRAASRGRGLFWGALAGFTSFVAHAGGPPVNAYLLPQRLQRTVFVATTVVFYLFVNYVKLVPYAWLGQFSPANLKTSVMLAPLAPLGMWLGVVLHRRMSDALFYAVCYGLLFATGVKLLYDVFATAPTAA